MFSDRLSKAKSAASYMIRRRGTVILALATAALLLLFSVTDFAQMCRQTRSEVLRLHILADSDGAEAQALKLKVRDRILSVFSPRLSAAENVRDAAELLTPLLGQIEETAEETLRQNGCRDAVKAALTEEYFPERTYDGATLPAGRYRALKIIIGMGEGHNWWCVLFPPLCVRSDDADAQAAAQAFIDKNGGVLYPKGEVKIKFKIVEAVEWLSGKIRKS